MVINDDCIAAMEKMEPESIDLIVADPPYNVRYKYNSYKDNLESIEYLEWQGRVMEAMDRVIKPTGSIFYLNYPEFNSLMYAWLFFNKDIGIKPQEIITWVYNSNMGGHPLRKASRTWLWLSKVKKEPPVTMFYGEYINHTDKRIQQLEKEGRRPREIDWWYFNQVKNVSKEKTEHPCQLPEKMLEKIVEATSAEGDVVLDPFAGSGSTLVVAKRLGRRYIGIESDEKYCQIIRGRLQDV
jgi:DNA modification methylase